ncbi:MAG TPA: hypothetical protein ENH20_00600, partial [Candidatus Pacearchaeota archaeon]|nr:hypothetical protein [Candidatus Pacearchaeota archaeon]
NQIKTGWDLLIDIDSPFLDYGKIAARLLIEQFEVHGIHNFGIKFSVSGDTPILIETQNKIKLMPIKQAINLLKQNEKIRVLSLDKNKKLIFSKVYNYLEHTDKIYEIYHAQNSLPVKATKHHSVFIWQNGKIIEQKVQDIKTGDFLITYNSQKNHLAIDKQIIENNFKLSKNQHTQNSFTTKIKITRDLMRLIGYFLSEGHITNTIHQTGFTFNINELEYIEDCKNLLTKITGKKISTRHPNTGSTQILIHSKEWVKFFDDNCGKKKDKHVPEFAWRLNKDLFVELLRGYIRGDGHKLGEYTITIKSVSKQMISEFVWLCKLNGISCTLSWEQSKDHMMSQGTLFKGSLIRMIHISKSELFPEFHRARNKFSPHPRDRTFPIDGLKKVYAQIKPKLFNHHRPEQMTLRKKCANLNRIQKVIDWFKDTASQEFTEESKKIISNYESLFKSDVATVEIKNIIEKENQEVFDISVEESEAFFGGDYPILLHNSGGKGFHIILPFKAFPKELNGLQTKDQFPDWPRAIATYLFKKIRNPMNQKILELSSKEKLKKQGELVSEHLCPKCAGPTQTKTIGKYICPDIKCKTQVESMKSNRKDMLCPGCNGKMNRTSQREIQYCETCKINTAKLEATSSYGGIQQKNTQQQFKEEITIKSTEDSVDVVLVSPRHLFRAPYSLHEKTAYASIPLDKSQIEDFKPSDADPLKITKIKNFMPDSIEGEATQLLAEALRQAEKEKPKEAEKKYEGKGVDLKGLTITDDMFPPIIKQLLKGIPKDGRKRALSLLLAFFTSLEFPQDYIEEKINEWNNKNYAPLKQGYIKSQISWSLKNKRLPPNYDKPIYKEFGITAPPAPGIKNPINYTIKKAFAAKGRPSEPFYEKSKNKNEI